ncbi:tudor domain-containing protein 5 [Bufo gargarizans]|uniref:tudor domain-containing protein 5 n=1 Tax=Bufo gargarizans TaxID=30331 RepID=UPI001CF5B415|nr:tudor domain-containing protein 5 [Bufo gargarizans]
MNKDRIFQTLKKDVRSLLIAAKLGLSIHELEHDYRMMIGSPLPVRSLDYRSTMELLLDMPDVVNISTNFDGTVLLSAVVNEETKSIAELVSKQKTSSKKKGISKRRIARPVCHVDLVRRGRIGPVLPASVKSELRDLLSISPLLVSQLEGAFYKRFGRSFQYTRYGFYSLIEVLKSVSDFVQVKQTRAGSLLMLKTPVTINTLKCSSFQYSDSGNVSKETICGKEEKTSPKTSLVAESPLPPAVPQSAGVTALDKLFMEASAQYFASHPSARSTNAGKMLSETFDKDFKLSLSHTSVGSVISSDLRHDIKHVVCKHAEGLQVSHLLTAFKQYTGKDLPFREMGFMSVLDLVGSLGDMLYLEGSKDGQDWRLFDIESKSKKNVDDEKCDEKELSADYISRWNVFTQKSERMKPPAILSLADGKNLWCPVDVPVSLQEIPPDAVRRQKLCSLSRMKRGFMLGVYVENVTSPSDFYIRCYSQNTSQKLEDMMIEMRFCYSNENVSSRYVVPDEYVIVGEIYALSVDGDVWWYRVIVHAFISTEEVQVFYPDFGTLATAKRRWLRFLKACYMKLPAQAVPSALAYLKPDKDQWSVEAIKIFQNQCARGPLVGVVLQYVSDQLCLFLCNTSTDQDIYLHQDLINAGHARMAEEPGFYKTRNPYVHYLTQSSEQPQEISKDTSGQSESSTAEPLDVHLQEPELHTIVKEEPEPELPYLEAFPVGEDIWDEKWSLSGSSTTSLNDALKSSSNNLGKQEKKPNVEQTNVFKRRSHGEQVSQPLEEFYISLIESKNTLEKSSILQSPPRNWDEFEKTAQTTKDLHDHSPPVTPKEEKLQSLEDNCLFNETSSLNQTVRSGNPLMGFQKFHIPRSSATVALGPSARLAACPGSLLHWVTEPGKV